MNRLLLLGLSALISCATLRADEPDKDVSWKAKDEIARRGAFVERVNGFESSADAVLIAEALSPPADDSGKWNITLVTAKNCKYCEQLRGDFENSVALQPWVNVKDYTKSWAHYQVVQIEDQSQSWRWKDYKPKSFPTLIVQPPFNQSWGDPHTIVFLKEGYDAKPDKLARDMRAAIDKYVKVIQPQRAAWKAGHELALAHNGGMQQSGGWTPPSTPPSVLPPAPNSSPSVPPSADQTGIDPTALLIKFALSFFPSAQTILLVLLTASNVWMAYREQASRAGVHLLVPDAIAKPIVDAVRNASGSPPTSPS